jgi:hypothetical protein
MSCDVIKIYRSKPVNVKTVEILRESDCCFVATCDNGGVRYGIKGVTLVTTVNPSKMAQALATATISDDDDFDDSISALFKPQE